MRPPSCIPNISGVCIGVAEARRDDLATVDGSRDSEWGRTLEVDPIRLSPGRVFPTSIHPRRWLCDGNMRHREGEKSSSKKYYDWGRLGPTGAPAKCLRLLRGMVPCHSASNTWRINRRNRVPSFPRWPGRACHPAIPDERPESDEIYSHSGNKAASLEDCKSNREEATSVRLCLDGRTTRGRSVCGNGDRAPCAHRAGPTVTAEESPRHKRTRISRDDPLRNTV